MAVVVVIIAVVLVQPALVVALQLVGALHLQVVLALTRTDKTGVEGVDACFDDAPAGCGQPWSRPPAWPRYQGTRAVSIRALIAEVTKVA